MVYANVNQAEIIGHVQEYSETEHIWNKWFQETDIAHLLSDKWQQFVDGLFSQAIV